MFPRISNYKENSRTRFRVLGKEKHPPRTYATKSAELTVKYFQRVFDAGLSVYCYYTKTSIDATPSAGETTPNYTGAISDHSVVKILEIY